VNHGYILSSAYVKAFSLSFSESFTFALTSAHCNTSYHPITFTPRDFYSST